MQQGLTGHVSSLLHDRDSREVFLRFASRSVADRLHGTIRSPGCLYRVLWGGAGDRETGDNRMDGWMDGYPVAVRSTFVQFCLGLCPVSANLL